MAKRTGLQLHAQRCCHIGRIPLTGGRGAYTSALRKMKTRNKTLAAFAFLALAVSAVAHAAPLLEWNMNGVDGTAPSLTMSGNGLTGTVTLGSGLTLGTTRANAWGATGFDTNSAATAFAAGDYFVFTITGDPGVTFSLDNLTYSISRSMTNMVTTGQWQYSLDGTNFTNVGSFTAIGTGVASAAKTLSTTSTVFDNMSGTVTFRLAVWGGSGTTMPPGQVVYLNNSNAGASPMTLNGTTSAVPEPTATALIALGVAGTLLARRRRQA